MEKANGVLLQLKQVNILSTIKIKVLNFITLLKTMKRNMLLAFIPKIIDGLNKLVLN